MTVTVPQFWMLKSARPDEVLHLGLRRVAGAPADADSFPKVTQRAAGMTPAPVRSITASPNSLNPRVEDHRCHVVGERWRRQDIRTAPTVLTLASANPLAVRSAAGPQQGGLLLPTSHAPAGDPAPTGVVGRVGPALEVVDDEQVAGRPLDQAAAPVAGQGRPRPC